MVTALLIFLAILVIFGIVGVCGIIYQGGMIGFWYSVNGTLPFLFKLLGSIIEEISKQNE